jgi:hypothetical protein
MGDADAEEADLDGSGNPARKRPAGPSNSHGVINFKENEAVEQFATVPQIVRQRRSLKTKLPPGAAHSIGSNEEAWLVTGENSVVAAGAVVTKGVPPSSFVAGIPAKVIRSLGENPGA